MKLVSVLVGFLGGVFCMGLGVALWFHDTPDAVGFGVVWFAFSMAVIMAILKEEK